MTDSERKEWAEGLNEFYCRFDTIDFTKERERVCERLAECAKDDEMPMIEKDTVEKVFGNINPNKAPGPDKISGKLLKACKNELSQVYCDLYNQSLQSHSIPTAWKNAHICPVPKPGKQPKSQNDYRPIALTSIAMKCLERIVLYFLKAQTRSHIDPNQFAYQQNRSVEDALLTLMHYAHTHLDSKGSYVRILFADFSSAFNTIQPHLLAQKLHAMSVNPHLSLWITNFLTNRTQSVKYTASCQPPPPSTSNTSSKNKRATVAPQTSKQTSMKTINTGAPQGTVISPFLFTLYTNNCKSNNEDNTLIKFSDDTAMIDISDDQMSYENEVQSFSDWCDSHYLDLNVTKTKEMIVDFKREQTDIPTLFINGQEVERVTEYNYLGSVIDNKLTFNSNADKIHKKCRQRLYILYSLRSLRVNEKILRRCYQAFILSVLSFSLMCWYESLSERQKGRLNGIVRLCAKIVGSEQVSLSEIYQQRVRVKAGKMRSDPTHVLCKYFVELPSGRRLRAVKFRTKRFKNTFIPQAVNILNS